MSWVACSEGRISLILLELYLVLIFIVSLCFNKLNIAHKINGNEMRYTKVEMYLSTKKFTVSRDSRYVIIQSLEDSQRGNPPIKVRRYSVKYLSLQALYKFVLELS